MTIEALLQAPIQAGCSYVLFNLLSVSSSFINKLMIFLYQHIENCSINKAQALRGSLFEVTKSTGCTQYWATFNLMDWR
jgi:CHAT domain-containing protein